MEELTTNILIDWEANRGATRTESAIAMTTALTGTANQIEWATQIKERVAKEFDRVANALRSCSCEAGGTGSNGYFGIGRNPGRETCRGNGE